MSNPGYCPSCNESGWACRCGREPLPSTKPKPAMTTREDEMRAKVIAELSYGLAQFADVQITGTAEKAIADRILTALSSEREILVEALKQSKAVITAEPFFDTDPDMIAVVAKIDAALTGVTGG